jgi:hypothetical protein
VELEELLFSCRHTQTSYTLDKVAAFLALANHDATRYANVNNNAEPWTKAYTWFARINLVSHNALNVLAMNNINPCNCWMEPIYNQSLAPRVFQYEEKGMFLANRKQPCIAIFDDAKLQLGGIQVDVVRTVWSIDAYVKNWRVHPANFILVRDHDRARGVKKRE